MAEAGAFAWFDTAIGRCAIAWRGDLVIGTALPGPLPRRFATFEERSAAGPVADAINAIRRLIAGEQVDLGFIVLDLAAVPPFERQVYEAARAIPCGETRTYGSLGAAIGQPGAAQAVGQALGRNPFPIIVPCHRILAASGRSGGFSASGGVSTKLRLLEIEQARREDEVDGLFGRLPFQAAP